jgi:hypothetical protein
VVTKGAGSYPVGTQTLTGLTVGRAYRFTCTFVNALGLDAYLGFGGFLTTARSTATSGALQCILIATATSHDVNVGLWFTSGVSGQSITFDNVSIKLLAGNHATQATSTQRPIYGVNPITGTRNLLTFTEQFDNAAWTKANATVTSGQVDPLGGSTAFNLTSTQIDGGILQSYTQLAATAYTFSIWVRRVSGTGIIEIRTSSDPLSFGSISVTSEWQRFSRTTTSNLAGAVTASLRVRTLGDVVEVWGAQIELGSTATAYQKVVSQYEVTEDGVQSVSYLAFDGVDDNMVIPSLPLTGAEPLFLCFGVKRLSTTSPTTLLSFGKGGNSAPTYPGFAIFTRGSAAPIYAPQLAIASATVSGGLIALTGNTFGDAVTRVLSVTKTDIRVNASGIATTGSASNFDGWVTQNNRLGCNYNFANNNFWKGNIYSAIFVASAVSAGKVSQFENFTNDKTGAY